MNRGLLAIFFILFQFSGYSQDFTGQWKGHFADKSTSAMGWGGNTCEYVLDLEVTGTKISGYSYTYFTDGGKKYYTICKLVGTIDKKNHLVEVRETERTKTNVPVTIINCFQVHTLSYNKESGLEILEGNWKPAPDQQGNCGFGITSLERRLLTKTYPRFSSTARNKAPKAPIKKSEKTAIKPKTEHPKKAPEPKKTFVKTQPPELKPVIIPAIKDTKQVLITPKNIAVLPTNTGPIVFEKRNSNLLKTLEIVNETIKVMLYDNGEIDGDSISLFYNNKLIVNNQRLTDKALTIELPVSTGREINELVMYAENLGRFPPNTALMIITDGSSRYEVRITSDLEKSGSIRFVRIK